MPWKELSVVSEREIFVQRLNAGEKMVDLCREYGVSRKTGYKFLKRFNDYGKSGLSDQSRRPESFARSIAPCIKQRILEIKSEFPTWGAAKIRERLRRLDSGLYVPARSTIHEFLFQCELVKRRRVRRKNWSVRNQAHVETNAPNQLWCADFKGQYRLKTEQLCYPLTITDHFSRYLIECEALENCRENASTLVFERIFKEFGLPDGIRTDNGSPFGSQGLFGLSKLNVWWLKLGIKLCKIQPGKPQQNGRHERMHLTLKRDALRTKATSFLNQQERFEDFKTIYNDQRPHESLQMRTPSELYQTSTKQYPDRIPEHEYKGFTHQAVITNCGYVNIHRGEKFFVSKVLGNETVGLKKECDQIWAVYFMNYRLGTYDRDEETFYPSETLEYEKL